MVNEQLKCSAAQVLIRKPPQASHQNPIVVVTGVVDDWVDQKPSVVKAKFVHHAAGVAAVGKVLQDMEDTMDFFPCDVHTDKVGHLVDIARQHVAQP